MKLGIVYWSGTGNTEKLAERAKETAAAKGAEVVFSDIDGIDRDAFFAADAFMIGGPAQGTEEIAEDMLDFTESIGSELSGKKVVLFGSFGWGDGAYMEDWSEKLTSKGAVMAADPVVCLQEPDDDAFAAIDAAVDTLLA